jgi:4,5-dihydroxyphthalate decarboxylase
MMENRMKLAAMMGTYPKTEALKSGAVTSPLFEFDFAPIDVATKGFKAVVRQQAFEVAELAIVTFLQAFAAGKPYLLLPFVMNGGFHHKSVLGRVEDGLAPSDLAGRRVAMRSYAQTTPTWVRGILSDDYGVPVDRVQWMSQETAHVAEYRDPAWVTPLDSAAGLEAMLLAGEVDAIIAGGGLSGDPRIQPLIPEPKRAALDWHARHGVVPINHMVVVHRDLAARQPEVVREIFRMLCESRDLAEPPAQRAPGPWLQPSGFDAVRPGLEMIIRYAHEQSLIPERLAVDALHGDVARALAG